MLRVKRTAFCDDPLTATAQRSKRHVQHVCSSLHSTPFAHSTSPSGLLAGLTSNPGMHVAETRAIDAT